jgi:hypothetical protein
MLAKKLVSLIGQFIDLVDEVCVNYGLTSRDESATSLARPQVVRPRAG